MKNCWKHINLPGWETAQDELYKYVTEVQKKYAYNMDLEVVRNCYPYPHDDMLDYVPALPKLVEHIGEIKSVSLICLYKPIMTIHTDMYTDNEGNTNAKWKLNIPVLNVHEKTTTYWYERTNPRNTKGEDYPFPYYIAAGHAANNKKVASNIMEADVIFHPDEMTKIDEVILDKPVIFDSHTPHNVVIEGWKFPRITASVYFKDNEALHEYL